MKLSLIITFQVLAFFLLSQTLLAQQRPDTLFQFEIKNPTYTSEKAPTLFIDEAHQNLHTLNGGFAPFAKIAAHDGYNIGKFTANSDLSDLNYLIIANPINPKNQGNWQRPIYPAFEQAEIEKIVRWVQAGGGLLLIADHMPFAGAASGLAQAFGFEFCDGFAQLAEKEQGREAFTFTNKRLLENIITDGSLGTKIDKVISFTGSSFSIPEGAMGVMKFTEDDQCLQPEIAWQFNESTPSIDLADHYQGAVMPYGEGRIAVFGEAAMFTAQTITQNNNTFQIGFNTAAADQNINFIRNVLRWLTADFSSME